MKSNDKSAHFICNFLIVVILGIIFNPVIGLAGAVIASFCKETYDEFTEDGSGWNWKEYRDWETDRKSTRLNSSHSAKSRMPSSA